MTQTPVEERRILVVDDDPDIREVLISALTDEGYQVDAALDGAEALDVLDRRRPDVILWDHRPFGPR